MKKIRKFRATKIDRGSKLELWAAADNRQDALLLISVLMRRGYEVDIAPDLPDPPEFSEFIVSPAGWKTAAAGPRGCRLF